MDWSVAIPELWDAKGYHHDSHYDDYGGLKKKCILRLAKAKMKMEKKMTLPILLTSLCCSASNQHKAQLTTIKKDGGRVLKKGMHFLFLE